MAILSIEGCLSGDFVFNECGDPELWSTLKPSSWALFLSLSSTSFLTLKFIAFTARLA